MRAAKAAPRNRRFRAQDASMSPKCCRWCVLAFMFVGIFGSAPGRAADTVSVGMVRLPTPVFVGIDRGYFAAESLRVVPVFSQSGGELVPALSTERIDIALASPGAALFNALAFGIDAKIVATYWTAASTAVAHDYAYVIARKDVARSGRLSRAGGARGMTFAITAHGQMTELLAAEYLKRSGLRLSDVRIVQLPFPDIEVAMRNRAVDLAVAIEPYAALGERDGVSVDVIGISAVMPDFVQAVVIYGAQLTSSRRDVGIRFLRAFSRANRYLRRALRTADGRRSVARIYQRYLPLEDPSIYHEIGLPDGVPDLHVSLGRRFGLSWQLEQYQRAGLVTRAPMLAKAVDQRFLDASR
jgi:NitT/TauT family transport system substrate-binding protein